jgi:hypothetical protein
MTASKLHSVKHDDHLIILLGQITKGKQGRNRHVLWSCHDEEEGRIKFLRPVSQKREKR